MPAKLAEDPAIIEALKAKASNRPGLYRFRLALIAIAGDLALTLTIVFPIIAFIVIGMVFYPESFWLGLAGIAFFVWVFRPSFRLPERELDEPVPALREALSAPKEKLRGAGRMAVYLDDSFNAAAMQTRGYLGMIGTRCGLILGVPLLLAVSREQLLAVIAHEFGHFSRRHGILGQWLYRARVGWIEYAKQVSESDSLLDVAAARYAEEFMPFFSARSFVESRQCEYEADGDAVLVVGARAFAAALTRIPVVGHSWENELPRLVATWRRERPEPPADFLDRFGKDLAARPGSELQGRLAQCMSSASSWIDTHPCLAERLGAAKQPPALALPAVCAGQDLFGDAWPKIVTEFNEKWRKQVQPGWLGQHLRLKHVVQPLLEASDSDMGTWSPEQRLTHAVALRETDAAAGLVKLRELHELHPQHKRVRFAYAAALLDESDEEGVGLMHILIREDPAFRPEGFQRVLGYYEAKGDSRQIRRWSAWVRHLKPHVTEAKSAFIRQAENGKWRASSLANGERAVIAETARLDGSIAGAWLLEGETALTYADDRKPT